MTVDTERAETYLRDLAESELRRYRGGAPQDVLVATARVRAVAAAFTRMEALDPGIADGLIDELATALEIRSDGERRVRPAVAHMRRAHRIQPGTAAAAGVSPVSVIPVGELLELRDGDTEVNVYLIAAITTPALVSLSAGILSLPKGSLSRRRGKREGLPSQAPRSLPGFALPGITGDLRAVDDTGQSYNLIFNGGGDSTWSAGQFTLRANPPGPQPNTPRRPAWLHVGNHENSVRIDLTAAVPRVPVTLTANDRGPGEQLLRIRAEAMFASGHHDIGTDLPVLATLVPALRAVGMLAEDSLPARQIAALCDRYAVPRPDIPDPPAPLPERWTSLLTGGNHAGWRQHDSAAPPPAAAPLPVGAFPETDGVTTALSGLVTRGPRTTVTGAFFGAVEEGYPEGPCIWLRDDGGQWHVAKPRNWGSGGIMVFRADVVPPLKPPASAVDILVINRTADAGASVPLTCWTS
jgi:hypothetical protein